MKIKRNTMHYNIMTSCDNNLIKYVAIQLYSISRNLKNSIVHYYLLHRNIPDESLRPIEALCHRFGNILFQAIRVPEAEKYDAIAKHGDGWCGETYFSICSHILLPETVKRVLYVDAGDIIFTGDISAFYHCKFEGKALAVTPGRYKLRGQDLVPYEAEDLEERLPEICRGLFNSGSYLMNLDRLREAQLTIDDWVAFSKMLCDLSGKQDTSQLYFGDQGLLSAAFVGDLKLYDYPKVKNLYYMPYNFCMWYYDRMRDPPPYNPAIVHLNCKQKPWTMRYPIVVERFSSGRTPMSMLKIGQAEWFYLWHEYAIITDQILKELGY